MGYSSGVEVAAEIYDLLNEDMRRFYPQIIDTSQVMLVELQDHILSTYDRDISDYASNLFSRHADCTYNASTKRIACLQF